MGICYSNGVIRDFAGPYYVSVRPWLTQFTSRVYVQEDEMAFGWPVRYWQLDVARADGGAAGWDRAVHTACDIYKGRTVRCAAAHPAPSVCVSAQSHLRQLSFTCGSRA
jgi:hypothetical protein